MNCVNHPETPATAYCRTCGRALCPDCQVETLGTVVCAEHAPVAQEQAPPPRPSAPPPGSRAGGWGAVPPSPYSTSVSPGLAFLLGLIPGVGAIYNGQYAKGLLHVVILGLLISIMHADAAGGMEPLFGMLTAVFFFYQAFEAFHTAKKRAAGVPVDEFSSIVSLHGGSGFPIGPVLLIALGCVFLLLNLDIIRLYQIVRYWPVFLIALGVYMLYARLNQSAPTPRRDLGEEARYER